MFRYVVLFAAAIAAVHGGAIPVTDCGSTATVREVRVEGCDAVPCVFYKGSSYVIELDGAGNSNTPTTKTLKYKISAHVIIDIIVREGDACSELTVGQCPAEPDEEFSFRTSIDVLNIYPATKTTVKAEVWGEQGNTLICIEVPVDVRNPPLVDHFDKIQQ